MLSETNNILKIIKPRIFQNLMLLLWIALILLVSCETRQKTKNINNVFVQKFFDKYNDSPKEAILDVYSSSKWLKTNINQADTAYIRLKSIVGQLGNYRGYEIIKSIDVGKSYKIVSALGKYDRQPIRFNFILYKPGKKWQIQNFNYDLNIESELEQNITLSFDY